MLRGFIAATVIRPVTTAMVTIAVVLFGVVALGRLPVDLLPDLSYPSITIRTTYPDAVPTEVEELVTRPVEELVGAVPGVVSVESVSREGTSEVVLDFGWGTAMDRAMADVREKLDRVVLPTNAERPVVLRYDPAQEPILRLALTSTDPDADLGVLRDHADRRVKRALEKLPGVAAVQLHGGNEDEVLVELDPARMAALDVSGEEIVAAIQRDNVNRPGGALTEQSSRYLVRTVHEARTPEALERVIVRSREGSELHLGELARIRRAAKEREELVLVEGGEAVELAVFREGDANTVAVAEAVVAEIGRLPLASGESLHVLANQAEFIGSAIAEVRDNTLIGAGLAVLVLLFFLRDLRATLVIALAIPVSLLATFVPLQLLGVSLNLMSLGGLALGVGMLVDNSIVVLEAIVRRRERPEFSEHSPAATATGGAGEVAVAVVSSTLTTVAVFLPMAFVEGVAGQLVRDLSWAVSFSILSSMLVSLTLVPVLLAGTSRGPNIERVARRRSLVRVLVLVPALVWALVRAVISGCGRVLAFATSPLTRGWDRTERLYPDLLRWCLRHRGVILLGGAGSCVVATGLAAGIGSTLLPELAQREFFLQVTLPQGTSLARSAEIARSMTIAASEQVAVDLAFARVGSLTQAGSSTGTVTGTHLAQVNLVVEPGHDHEIAHIEARVLEACTNAANHPRMVVRLGHPSLFSFDAPLELQVFAEEPERASAHARRILPELAAVEGIAELAPDDLAGRPEVRVDFDRERLGRVGIGVDVAVKAVQRALQGEVATKLHAPDRQLDVRVQLPRVDRSRVSDVGRIQVGIAGGVPVILTAVAEVGPALGPAEIRRIDGRRGLRIRARVLGADLGGAATGVDQVLRNHSADDAFVQAYVSGQAEEMQASLRSLAFTALLAMFLVYVVMAATFESLLHPFLIMLTMPMAFAGVALGCAIVRLPLSAMVGMGGIILAGIVVNNAIVLVDSVNQRRGRGASVEDALLDAGSTRLRPILMTTTTTVLGLVPMALGIGDGAALRQPLAVSIIGGLSLSTLLTLVMIPCVYSLLPGRNRAAWAEPPG